jgi:hypothetical protein
VSNESASEVRPGPQDIEVALDFNQVAPAEGLICTGVSCILARMTGPVPAERSTPWRGARIHLSVASLLAGALGTLAILLACGGGEGIAAKAETPVTPAAPTSAAPAEPAKTAGCARDMDCKGERVCEAGECVNPK